MANVGHSTPVIWLGVPDHAQSRRWIISVALAGLLHIALAMALLMEWRSSSVASVETPLAAMTVELAPLPTTAKQQPSEAPPGPEQVEQQLRRKPQPKPVQFDPPPVVRSVQQPDALAEREQEIDARQDNAQVAVDKTTAAPSSLSKISDDLQAPVEGAPSDSGADAIQSWQDRLLAHLEHHKRYPRAAQQRRQEDVIYLRFRINRSGVVLDWSISRSRGYALLDAEVDALIQRASPLPPPPEDIGGNPIEMVMPVEFFLQRQLARGG
jgi:protein TonB